MAGSDQSVNLGGMLSQIAQTTGQMGGAYQPVMQAATKPRGDMNDPQHLQRLAEWASSNGDASAASMYMQQARQLSAELDKKKAEAKQLQATQSANAVTAQYKKALETGDADLIAKAEEAVMAGANANGYSAQDRLNAASSAVKQQNDVAYAESERKRVAEERAAAAKFTQKLSGVTDPKDIQDVVDQAPPEMLDQVQRMATARLSYLANMKSWEDAEAANKADVSTDFTAPEGLSEDMRKALEAEHARLVKLAADGKQKDGTWKEGARRAVSEGMKALNKKALDGAFALATAEESDKRQRLRSIDYRRQQIAIDQPTKEEARRIAETLTDELNKDTPWYKSNVRPTHEQIVKRFRDDQRTALDQELAVITGTLPTEETAPTEGGVVEVDAESEAEALPKGTKFRLPDGRTGTVG